MTVGKIMGNCPQSIGQKDVDWAKAVNNAVQRDALARAWSTAATGPNHRIRLRSERKARILSTAAAICGQLPQRLWRVSPAAARMAAASLNRGRSLTFARRT